MSHILAIDQGTSATKCVLVDTTGRIVAKASAALGESYPQPGWVEQDAQAIWLSVLEAVRLCIEQKPQARVAAVGLSTQRESALIWNRKDASPVTPLLSWQDRRTVGLLEALAADHVTDMVLDKSGLPLDPMFSALKIRWLLDRVDPDRTASRNADLVAGTVDAWLVARLGGESTIEVGNASRTQLLNVANAAWDDDLLRLFNIPVQMLPEIVPSIRKHADAAGLHPSLAGVPVSSVMADSHAALYAHGVREVGSVKATMGTGSSVMGLARKGAQRLEGMCLTVGWDAGTGPRLAHEGNIRSAGATLRWAADLFGIDAEVAAAEAVLAPAGELCIVPAFSGLGAPYWDARAVGLMSGLTLDTNRQQVLAAALDSIAHQVADVVAAVDGGGDSVKKLLLDGGPSRNATLRASVAAYIKRPVVHCTDPELSALGVAHLAGLREGVWDEAALQSLARSQVTTEVPERSEEEISRLRSNWALAVTRSRTQRSA
ncbi:FGGY family carbohydrate kinase [Rhodoferax sp. GW822-FHT02A01]|uniref:FGGY family carbohydrate kinase n=1 Tax=Rhodoferax sp. GW822-FHT02A01 TaxID=3141537 RepID=UPI00315D62E1